MKLVVQGTSACHAHEIGTEQHERDICLSTVRGVWPLTARGYLIWMNGWSCPVGRGETTAEDAEYPSGEGRPPEKAEDHQEAHVHEQKTSCPAG